MLEEQLRPLEDEGAALVRVRVRVWVRVRVKVRVRVRVTCCSPWSSFGGIHGFHREVAASRSVAPAWYHKGGRKFGGFGGGWLEHPRQWLGAQWVGLFLGVPSCPEPPGAS